MDKAKEKNKLNSRPIQNRKSYIPFMEKEIGFMGLYNRGFGNRKCLILR